MMNPLPGRPRTTTTAVLKALEDGDWVPFHELRAGINSTYRGLTSALYRLHREGRIERKLEFPGYYGEGPGGSVAAYRLRKR